jgi:hypothetical protein
VLLLCGACVPVGTTATCPGSSRALCALQVRGFEHWLLPRCVCAHAMTGGACVVPAPCHRVQCLWVRLCDDATFCCAGYACSNGTGVLSADTHGCSSATLYCPLGSTTPTPTPSGFYASPTPSGLFFNATQCEVGRYCVGGAARACPAGRYGALRGLTSELCTGNCSAGYYCPAGSTSPTQLNCSDGPAYFCAEVSGSMRGVVTVTSVSSCGQATPGACAHPVCCNFVLRWNRCRE